MKVRALNRFVGGFVAAAVFLAGCNGSQNGSTVTPQGARPASAHRGGSKKDAQTTAWTVQGRSIELNGKDFFVKGVDYGSSQIDSINQAPVANPLDDAYEAIWSKDLALMRADGVNAVKVYNVTLSDFKTIPNYNMLAYNQPSPKETGKIDKFMAAAWNGGDRPIYVVLSIFFGGADVLNPPYIKALGQAYKIMAQKYGADPALMGISIGSEINAVDYIKNPTWWNQLNIIPTNIEAGFNEANNAKKITTTTMVDGTEFIGGTEYLQTPYYGDKYGFKNDTWGVDVYRGPDMGQLFKQIKTTTKKPTIIAEYSASAAWYPASPAKHGKYYACEDYQTGYLNPPYFGLPAPRPWEDAKELPSTNGANPNISDLVNYATKNQTQIYENSVAANAATGVDSGGFYFEFNDEWWKSGWSHSHIGGAPGPKEYPNQIAANAQYPGCYDDQAWYGLYQDVSSGTGDIPYPVSSTRNPDMRVARPSLAAMKTLWAQE